MNEYLEILRNNTIFANPIWENSFAGNTLRDYTIALILFAFLTLIFWLVKKVIIKQVKKYTDKTKNTIDDNLIIGLNAIKMGILILLAFYLSLQTLVLNSTFAEFLFAILVILGVWQIIYIINVALRYFLKHNLKEDQKEYSFLDSGLIQTLSQLALWAIGILFILSNLGINVVSLLAGLGIGGIAIALALQNILEDLFSSFAIYFDKPFAIGDFIVVGENMGNVQKIGIKTTRLKSLQGEEIVITNKELTGARIQNYKKMKERRVVFQFGVTYQTDNKKMQAIPGLVRDIIEDVENARYNRAHFLKFGDSALIFETVYYVESGSYEIYMDVNQAIHLHIKKVFEKKGIEMAYPTQTIYVSNVEGT